MMFTSHHLVFDGWSRGVLLWELAACYAACVQGHEPALPALPVQYRQFARWQRARLKAQELEAQLAYWREQLKAPLPLLELPSDRPRPPRISYRGDEVTFVLPEELAARLRALGRGQGVTLFMLLVAGWALLMARYAGQSDVIVGTATSGRARREFEGLIGCFVNTLALRVSLAGDPRVPELLERVRECALGAYTHQDVPFEKLVDELQPERRLDRTPVFQTWVMLQNTPSGSAGPSAVEVHELPVADKTARFELALGVMETPAGVVGPLRYSSDLFDRASVARLAGHLVELLRGFVERPEARVSELPLLTAAERRQVLEDWNATAWAAADAHGGTLAEWLEAQAARTPDAPALTCRDERLSYRELHARANQVARRLRGLGVGPDTPVAVCLERSPHLVIALLGVWKAGGAYVPLDPAYPQARLALVLEDAQPAVLLTEERLLARVPRPEGLHAVCLDADAAALALEAREPLPPVGTAANLAYVIFTSGSTGRPKGVMVPHSAVRNFVAAMDQRLGVPQDGVWLAVTSVSFDISVLEIFWTLARGLHVVLQASSDVVALAPEAPRPVEFSLLYFASDGEAGASAGGGKYRLLLDGARFADEHGFTAVWMPERHFHSFGGIFPNPAVTAAAVAAVTRRVQIRAGSVVLPLHDPIRVAEEWAMVDNLSGGRVGLSLATGWNANDFVFAPERYATRRELLPAMLDELRRLWRGETITRTGGAGRPVELRTLPRPIQPDLRIWLTAAGSPDTFRKAGELGLGVLTHLLGQSPEELAEKLRLYREAWRAAGHGPGDGHVALMLHTFLGAEGEDVREIVRGPFSAYLRDSVDLMANLARSLGLGKALEMFDEDDMQALVAHAFERYSQTSGLFGSVTEGLAMTRRLAAMGVDELACLIDFGVENEAVLRGLQHLSELKRRFELEVAEARQRRSSSEIMLAHGVTHLQCTPSWARLLLADPEAPHALRGLRQILLGGEALPAGLAGELWPHVRGEVFNMYGPTETTVWSAAERLAHPAEITLGRPLVNTQIYLVDAHGQLAPAGVPGEICIGGQGVARGYLRRPELTAERFVPDPFGPTAGARLYRTGDRGRWRSDGRLEFMGRDDQQVKLRGHRIELPEIEAALRRQEGVREAVVLLREDVPGEPRLVAYVVPTASPAVPGETLQTGLRALLPDYMVPAAVVHLDVLPLTPNGKIDRRRLPAPSGERPSLAQTYVAPRTPVEAALVRVWSEVLRLDRVGVHDNFFALGGDSILSLQIVARATQSGLRIATRQVFEHQTVAALAQVVTFAAARQADQGPLAGPVPLLPIQRWFFDRPRPAAHHYNQQVRLGLAPAPPVALLERAWALLLRQHDALRFRFTPGPEGWVQAGTASETRSPLATIDLRGVAPAEEAAVQRRVATAVQASLDLEHGPLARAALILGGDGASDLFLVAHHLVIDGVSWRVLLDDLQELVRQLRAGQRPALPPKTASVRDWTDVLATLAGSDELLAELPVWNAMNAPAARLPRDTPAGVDTAGTVGTRVVTLSREETRALVQELPARGVGQVQELLLAALVDALSAWAGEPAWRIDLEGHGREDLPGALDVSRTVGWFTTLYPVRLEAAADPLATLRAVKTTLRAVPRHGLGYGMLRYLAERPEARALAQAAPAEIIFNYLGQADQVLAPAGPVRASSGPAGAPRDRRQPREYGLEINGITAGGRLQLALNYGRDQHRAETIERLAEAFSAAARALVACSSAASAAGRWLVPADFALAQLSQAEVDQLATSGPLADAYPLSPMQQGLLFHSVYEDAESSLYTLRFRGYLEGALDVEAFRRAWQTVVGRHDILRTGFVWNRAQGPLQVVYANAEMPWLVEDWRRLPPEARAARQAELLAADERRGFTLERPPLMRLTLARLEDTRWYALWTGHHLIVDGWTVPLVMNEVLAVYDASLAGRPAPPAGAGRYRDYIAWLQRQDLAAAERFWRRTLDGFSAPSLLVGEARSGLHRTVSKRSLRIQLEQPLTDLLQQLGREHALTLNTWVAGAWALVIGQATGKRDVLFGAVVSGRPPQLRDVERTPGVFVNTLPVRVAADPGEALLPWLARLQAQQTEARDYEYTPLGQVQTWSAVPAGAPLFDVLFIYENYPVETAPPSDGSGLRIVRSDPELVIPTTYPLVVQVAQHGATLGVELVFDAARVGDDVAQGVLDGLGAVLAQAAAQPERSLGSLLDVLQDAEDARRAQERERAAERQRRKLQGLRRVPQ
jgi:natural product biosynthesis luciferase-like monooxygenase protein/non-ribosomal peptide synthase protein (TIGR01720 family)